MSIRVGVAGLKQESNSFAPAFAGNAEFHTVDGNEIPPQFGTTNSEVAGFLDGCRDAGWIPEPLSVSSAVSGGPLSRDCFERRSAHLLSAIAKGTFEALLLSLHGAMSSECFASADLEIVSRVRALIGPQVPLVVSLDFHANIQPGMLDLVDGLIGFRTYPHLDQRATGRRAARILHAILSGQRPSLWHLPLPLLFSPEACSTFEAPVAGLIASLERSFPESEGSFASLFCVQPWLDLPNLAGSLTLTAFNPQPSCAARLRQLAQDVWSVRDRCGVPWTSFHDLERALTTIGPGPVLVSEAYDSPTAGATGNDSRLIEHFLLHPTCAPAAFTIVDPAFVARALPFTPGQELEADLGANLETRFSSPVRVRAALERTTNGRFKAMGAAFHGRECDMGPTVVVSAGKNRIVVASRPVMMSDPELYRSQGIEPRQCSVIGIKSALQFKAAYEEISTRVIHLDAEGPCRGRLSEVPFKNVRRPLFPLDRFCWECPEPTRVLR